MHSFCGEFVLDYKQFVHWNRWHRHGSQDTVFLFYSSWNFISLQVIQSINYGEQITRARLWETHGLRVCRPAVGLYWKSLGFTLRITDPLKRGQFRFFFYEPCVKSLSFHMAHEVQLDDWLCIIIVNTIPSQVCKSR